MTQSCGSVRKRLTGLERRTAGAGLLWPLLS